MRWADKFKKKSEQKPIEAEATDRQQYQAPTPPQKISHTSEYDSIDKIMEQVHARMEANATDTVTETNYGSMPSKELSGYANAEEVLKSGANIGPRAKDSEYGVLPNQEKREFDSAISSAADGNRNMESYIKNQISEVTNTIVIDIKTKEGVKIDSFKSTPEILNTQLQDPVKAEKFIKAMESAIKEPDQTKQNEIIKGAVKEVVSGHKTDLIKELEKTNPALASSVIKDSKQTFKNTELPENKQRPTGKGGPSM